jgi:hypothetical protein
LHHAYPAWIERPRAGGEWLDRLKAWRPRRPTLLLLDDPQLNDANTLISTLHDVAQAHYLHPVRLLIVNQTAPAELGLQLIRNEWTVRGGLPPLGRPIILADTAWFTAEEVRTLRAVPGLLGNRYPLRTDGHVDSFLRITRGNPLLVELGMKALRQGQTLDTMSEDSLLRDRVDRILDAMRQAGLSDPAHERALAVATIATGARSRRTVNDAYPLPERPEELARVFPNEPVDLREVLPPIRPELVGDAFARHVLDGADAQERARMVRTAWTANPAGTLRSSLRLGGRTDELGMLLRPGPPPDAGLDTLEVAMAFTEAALFIDASLRPEMAEARAVFELVPVAADWLAKLSPADATIALERLLQLAEDGSPGRHLHATYWLQLAAGVLSSAMLDPEAAMVVAARMGALIDRRLGYSNLWPEPGSALLQAWHARLNSPGWRPGHIIRLAENARRYPRSNAILAQGRAAMAWRERIQSPGASRLEEVQLAGAIARLVQVGAPDEVRTAAEHLEAIAAPFPGDRSIQLERAQAWCCVVLANCVVPSESARWAAFVDKIAAPFPGDRHLQMLRAHAWRYAAGANLEVPAECARLAAMVDRIAAPFSGDRDLQHERAQAWRYAAFANQGVPAECARLAAIVDMIAAPFPGDSDIQYQRAHAWRSVAYTNGEMPAESARLAAMVDNIAAPYLDDRGFQYERALAWRYAAYANRGVPAECARLAGMVDKIAAPFPGDRDLQLERSRAWVSFAHADQAVPAECARLAAMADSIATRFPGERDFQHERARAWRLAARANREVPAECVRLATIVDKIAVPFPADCDLQLERAQAWGVAAYANRQVPAECARLAAMVDTITAPFPRDRNLQLERSRAWRYVAYSRDEVPEECARHAEMVDGIAAPFPRDRDFHHERAQAWRSVAYANRRDAGAHAAALGRVQAIAERFPDDEGIAQELRVARGFRPAPEADALHLGPLSGARSTSTTGGQV